MKTFVSMLNRAVEKSLKALLVRLDKPFPKTHSIGMLLKLIEETGVEIPGDINRSKILTDYAYGHSLSRHVRTGKCGGI